MIHVFIDLMLMLEFALFALNVGKLKYGSKLKYLSKYFSKH